jgi:hypothetical protein
MYTENDYSRLPGADAINDLLDTANIPHELFWFPAIFGMVIAAIFGVYWLSKSMVAASLAGGALLVFYALLGPIPLWIVVPYAIMAAAVIVKRETVSL